MSGAFAKYGPFLALNFACHVIFSLLIALAMKLIFYFYGQPSGPYLGQVLLAPGIYFLCWAPTVALFARRKWIPIAPDRVAALQARAIPIKFLLVILCVGLIKASGVQQGTMLVMAANLLVLLFGFIGTDYFTATSGNTSTKADRFFAAAIPALGVLLIILGSPIYGLIFR